MKSYLMMGLAAASMLASSTSHALVEEIANCQTKNEQYTVEITNNEGIGPVRTANFGASITNDRGEVVGAYALETLPTMEIGAGTIYVDKQTKGDEFRFELPGPVAPLTSVRAILNDRRVLSDDNLKCEAF